MAQEKPEWNILILPLTFVSKEVMTLSCVSSSKPERSQNSPWRIVHWATAAQSITSVKTDKLQGIENEVRMAREGNSLKCKWKLSTTQQKQPTQNAQSVITWISGVFSPVFKFVVLLTILSLFVCL